MTVSTKALVLFLCLGAPCNAVDASNTVRRSEAGLHDSHGAKQRGSRRLEDDENESQFDLSDLERMKSMGGGSTKSMKSIGSMGGGGGGMGGMMDSGMGSMGSMGGMGKGAAPIAAPIAPDDTEPPSQAPIIMAPIVAPIAPPDDTEPPTQAPVDAPSPAPIDVEACPDVPAGGCSICGTDSCITIPDPIFSFPGSEPASCSEWQQLGYDGDIPPRDCARFPTLLGDLCGCLNPTAPTSAPVGEAPNFAPVMLPTPVAAPPTPSAPPTPPPTLPPSPTIPSNCPAVPDGGCSVCGEDESCITIPDAILEFPGQPPIACNVLQEVGYDGLIAADDCAQLPPVIDELCGCQGPTTPPPVPAPTPIPTATGNCPAVPALGCSVCGDDSCVTIPDAVLEFPDQPPIPCGALQQAGYDGLVSPGDCVQLPPVIDELCGCQGPSSSAPAPAPTPIPTAAGDCPAVPALGCSVCGDDSCVTIPDAALEVPDQPPIPCFALEQAGYDGLISPSDCVQIPLVIDELCGCQGPTTPAPVPASTPIPTATSPSNCPAVPALGCSVCGDDSCITIPDAALEIPNQPPIPCGALQQAGYDGLVSPSDCVQLPPVITDLCGCQALAGAESAPADAPAAPVAPVALSPVDLMENLVRSL